jgi:hypothetical protein
MDKKLYDDSNWREESLPYHTGRQAELLENGPKSLSQSWLMGAMYNQWKRRNGYDKFDPQENEGQLQSSLGEFFKKQNEVK